MERHFEPFRRNIIGIDHHFTTPYGNVPLVYADWIASGRLYRPIEDRLTGVFGPFIGNTHTETSETGTLMTKAYHYAQRRIKDHVNAGPDDVIITAGFGMTAVVNKMQRMLGLKTCGMVSKHDCLKEVEKPVVFLTHMEHHSNHTTWFETFVDVVQVPPADNLLIDLDRLRALLEQYKHRRVKIGSFTACSNVTGIQTPIHKMARLMHEYNGWCFADYAASAPYADINMHPGDDMEKLDAVFFSPHKFLGGPGSSGVLIFDKRLYEGHRPPDQPGGGTVDWTNPWGEYKYIDDIEAREDGGTPGFLQAIRAALAIELKEQMGTANIHTREAQLIKEAFHGMSSIPGMHILAENATDRQGIISFYLDGVHFNLAVKLLNDRFGIQVRGGCACAGTYGHYLLDVSYDKSHEITRLISSGDLSLKPGWIRLSLHPTMTGDELGYIIDAIRQVAINHKKWEADYIYNRHTNEFRHHREPEDKTGQITGWFTLDEKRVAAL
jgi:selenocysteine lyase/cysteine desulfurase